MEVSEIFDSVARFDAEMGRRRKCSELRQQISAIGTTCGDCTKWMKRGTCPKERGTMVGGPSSGTWKCGSFVEKPDRAQFRMKLQGELAALSPTTPQPRTP